MVGDFSSLPRCDAGRQDRFEVLGTVTIGVRQVSVRDAAQPSAQFAGHADGVELGALAHDGLDRIDMMRDQLRRHLVEIGRVFDDPAQALGGSASGGVPKSGGVALDVMGGAERLRTWSW